MIDNTNAYFMQSDGSYKKLNTSQKKLISSHFQFCKEAKEAINGC